MRVAMAMAKLHCNALGEWQCKWQWPCVSDVARKTTPIVTLGEKTQQKTGKVQVTQQKTSRVWVVRMQVHGRVMQCGGVMLHHM